MGIIPFTFDPALRESFLRLGREIYREDPLWIPPGEKELRSAFLPEFPFYGRAGNDCRHFIALKGRHAVGRVSAMVNRDLADREEKPVGVVGFFECVADYSVARGLLDEATCWLHEKKGLSRIWGPMNFDIWHGYRFMTRGFESQPFFGEPYNKPYYPEYFQRYGFVDKYRWDTVEVAGRARIEQIISRGTERRRELLGQGYRFENLELKEFPGELRKLHRILTESYRNFLGFTPISCEEFSVLFGRLRYAVDPRFFLFVVDPGNAVAGFAGALLDLADAVRSMSGKDNLISRIRFLYSRRRVSRINFYIIGVTPEVAGRQTGLGRAACTHVLEQILRAGYEKVLFTLLAKGNVSHGLTGGNAPQREYALFEWNA